MKKPETFLDLIESWGSLKEPNDKRVYMWKDLGESRQQIAHWKAKGYIPQKHWPRVLVRGKRRGFDLTYPDLLRMQEKWARNSQ